MYHPASSSGRQTLLGVHVGQLIAWQLIAIIAVVALIQHGPQRWALAAVAAVGCGLTLPRWRHRWAYEWLRTGWSFRQARRAHQIAPALAAAAGAVPVGPDAAPVGPDAELAPPPAVLPEPGPETGLPPIDVTPVRVRSGAEAGVAHDGDGFAVILALRSQPAGPPVVEVPVAALAGLLDPQDTMVSAVQFVLHADLAAGAADNAAGDAESAASGPAAAYRNLGYHRMPRSQSTWLVLRHDPAASGFAVAAAGTARDAHGGLVRTLAGRGLRALDLIADLPIGAQLLEAQASRDLMTGSLLAQETTPIQLGGLRPQAAAGPAHQWGSWQSATRRHITYRLRRWPPGGLQVLQQGLATVPALSLATAVVIARTSDGQVGLTATVRVTTGPTAAAPAVSRAVIAAAAACGARLVRLDGEHAAGVLATLPLGRGPAGGGRSRAATGLPGSAATIALPVTEGGVVLGGDPAEPGGSLVAFPFFSAAGATRVTMLCDTLLPRLLALRALGAGARLQVVTHQPAGWLRLRGQAQLPPDRMLVVRPGTQHPSSGTRADPWMIMDDTGVPAAPGSRPWQAVVTVLGQAGPVLADQDAILAQRTSPDLAAMVGTALRLTGTAAQSLSQLPDGIVALARPGAPIRLAQLAPDPAERMVLASSLQAG